MAPIADLFNGQVKPDLYRLRADVAVESLQRQAEEHGWQLFHIDGAKTHDKRSFIRTAGKALDFPAYSAQNWDSFEESLRDLTWAPPKAIWCSSTNQISSRRAIRSNWLWRGRFWPRQSSFTANKARR